MAGRIAYLGNISAQGLVLNLDAAIQGSYPKTGTLWTDISGNNNNGTLTNGPAYTGSDYGAIVFDGTNDYVNLPNITISPSSPFTINSWVYFASGSGIWPVIANASGLSLLFGIQVGTGTYTGFNLYLGSTGVETSVIGRPLFNQWYNVVGNYDGSRARIYINGAPASISANTGSTSTLSGFTLGNGSAGGNSYWKGNIANNQIYNQSLSQFQVWQNFNAYKSRYGIPDIVTDSLILNLDAGNPYSYLSGSSGTTWSNTVAVSSSISGTLVNGTTYSNGAMVFDGVDDYVTTSGLSNTHSTSSLTLEAWITVGNSYSYYAGIFGKGTNDSDEEYCLLYNKNINKLYMDVGNSVGPYIDATYNLSLNTTYHIVGTHVRTGGVSTLTLYVNGVFVSNTTLSSGVNANVNTYITTIGSRYQNGTDPWNGKIYTANIYNRALTQTEITQNFNALRGRYGI